MNKINPVMVIGLLLFAVMLMPSVSAITFCDIFPFFWFCTDDETGNTLTATDKWTTTKHDGVQEEYFYWTSDKLGNGKSKVCLWQKEPRILRINDPIVQESRATLRKNGVQTGIVEPSDMEVETEQGKLKKMCVDVDKEFEDYIRFGTASTVFEYLNDTLEASDENGTVLQDVTLTANSGQCLVNCWAEGQTVIYQDSTLFDAYDFKDINDNLQNPNSRFLIENNTIETLNQTLYTDNCTEVYDAGNDTYYDVCNSIPNGWELVNITIEGFQPYNFEILPSGTYNWRIEANKDIYEELDWAFAFQGFDTDTIRNYWAWWNTTWEFKKLITNISGEYPSFNITKETSMQGGFEDLRFLDSTETTELNYTLRELGGGTAYSYDDFDTALLTNLEFYYKLDGTSGVVVDSTGNSDGDNYNPTRGVTGKLNNAFDFDGDNDYVDTNYILPLNQITINQWVKPTTKSGATMGISRDYNNAVDGIELYWTTDTNFRAVRRGVSGAIINLPYPDDFNWHMITISYTTNGMKGYIDGQLVTQCTTTGCKTAFNSGVAFTQNLKFGGFIYNSGTQTDDYDGVLDEVGLWDSPLSDEDIKDLYQAQWSTVTVDSNLLSNPGAGLSYDDFDAGLLTNLQAYYKFEEASGVPIDSLGNYAVTNGGGNPTYQQTGIIDFAMEGDGTDPKFSISNTILDEQQDFTISTWINLDTGAIGNFNPMVIQDSTEDLFLLVEPAGNIRFRVRTGSGVDDVIVDSPFALQEEKWYHIVAVKDGSGTAKMNLYVNGQLVAQEDDTHTNELSLTLDISLMNYPAVGSMDGLFDETGIWDKALSADEVTELYNNGPNEIYMYYGNDLASSTSNANDTFLYPVTYWEYDDGSLLDSTGANTITNYGAEETPNGYVFGGYDFVTAETDYMKMDSVFQGLVTGGGARSVNMWINSTSDTPYHDLFWYGTELGNQLFHWRLQTGTNEHWFQEQSGGNVETVGGVATVNEWTMVTMTYDGVNTVKLYTNGIEKGSAGTFSLMNTGSTNQPYVGVYGTGLQEPFDGVIDEISYYDKTLTATEVLELSGLNPSNAVFGAEETASGITVTLITPADLFSTTNSSIDFQCNGIATGDNVTQIDLYIDDIIVNTTTGTGDLNLTSLQTVSDGNHNWTCSALDQLGNQTNATETRTFSVDANAPFVNITAPLNLTVFEFNESFNLNWTINDTNLDACWYTFDLPPTFNGTQYPELKEIDNNNLSESGASVSYFGWIYITDRNSQDFQIDMSVGAGGSANVYISRNAGEAFINQANASQYQQFSGSVSGDFAMTMNANGWHFFEIELSGFGGSTSTIDLFRVGAVPIGYAVNNDTTPPTPLTDEAFADSCACAGESSSFCSLSCDGDYGTNMYSSNDNVFDTFVFDFNVAYPVASISFITYSVGDRVALELFDNDLSTWETIGNLSGGLVNRTTTVDFNSKYVNGSNKILVRTHFLSGGTGGQVYEMKVGFLEDTKTILTCNDNSTLLYYPASNPLFTTYNVFANDTFGNVGSDSTIVYRNTNAPNITIHDPETILLSLFQGETLDLNFSITTNGTLDVCWFDYNSTITFTNCSANTTFIYQFGVNNLTFYANDTLGNLGSESRSWIPKVFENSQTFNAVTIEGKLENYTLNITVSGGYDFTSAILHYGNFSTTSANNVVNDGQDRIISLFNYQVDGVENFTNVTFFWELTLNDSSTFNTTSNVQLITPIDIDDCTLYNFTVLNISLFDEEFKTPLTGKIEIFIDLLNSQTFQKVTNVSDVFEGVHNLPLCMSINLTAENYVYSAEIRYSSDGYSSELYNIQRASFKEGGDPLSLFDLNSNDTTVFTVTYKNDDFVIVPGAVMQLQRKYIGEGVFETVEAPLTSSEGIALLHIDLDATIYNIIMVKNGEVLDIFQNLVFDCENELSGSCTLNLFGDVNPLNDLPIVNINDFGYAISSAGTTFTVTYTIPSGTASTINMELTQLDMFGNETLCSETIFSAGGSISCTYNNLTLSDSYLNLKLTKDGVPQVNKQYFIQASSGVDFLDNNFILVFVIMLSLVGMAFSSPEFMVINGIAVMLISGSLYLLNGLNFVMGLGLLMWLVIAGVIIIYKMSRQEDR